MIKKEIRLHSCWRCTIFLYSAYTSLEFHVHVFEYTICICLVFVQVIEYIQFLKEKLNLYEGSCQEWNTEPTKLTPWVGNMCVSMSGTLVIVSENFVTFAKIPSLCSVTIL